MANEILSYSMKQEAILVFYAKNRIQNCLTVSNIQLANVVSDTFCKSSMRIIDYLLKNPDDKDFNFVPLLHASMLGKVDKIRLALDGMITPEQQQKNEYYPSTLRWFGKVQVQS